MHPSRRPIIAAVLAALLLTAALALGTPAARAAGAGGGPAVTAGGPVIVDNDVEELGDSAQSMFMLMQARAHVLGVTVESGNVWQAEGLQYALSQERLIGSHVPVYRGTDTPLSGDRQPYLKSELRLFGSSVYVGAWARKRPRSYRHLPAAPYGGYATARPAAGTAAQFIISELHRYPHKVTIVAGGAMTNLALAIREDPSIVHLAKQVVYMAGALTVPGNTTPAAEFNVWFDPAAAKIVFDAPWPRQAIVPLDLTNQVHFGRAQYERIARARPATPITREFRALFGPTFRKNPHYSTYIYDTIASAIFLQPSLIERQQLESIDVDTAPGLDFGRTLGYAGVSGPAGSGRIHAIEKIDIPRFFDLYVKEFTRPPAR